MEISSAEESDDIFRLPDRIAKSKNKKRRQSTNRKANKQIQEKHYSSTYPAYTPTYYNILFINRKTTIEELVAIREQIQKTSIFTLDTESTTVRYQPNIPTLIQVQVCTSAPSTIIILEAQHLPTQQQQEFQLIQKIFDDILQPSNKIFSWGGIIELNNFIQFGLFDERQINSPENRDLQQEFKLHWDRNYPHETNPGDGTCKCRNCFGIGHKPLISLQDVVAFQLNEYLNKEFTCENFMTGLDPKLVINMNTNEYNHRKKLSQYASNDCDSIFKIISSMNLVDEETRTQTTSNQLVIETIVHDDIEIEVEQPSIQHSENPLTTDERRRIHNRSRTLHQRQMAYKHEIFIRNIDHRYPVRQMKITLKSMGIEITQVNPLISNKTNERILRVGLKQPNNLEEYEEQTEGLFSTRSYHRNCHKFNKQRRRNHREHRNEYRDEHGNEHGNEHRNEHRNEPHRRNQHEHRHNQQHRQNHREHRNDQQQQSNYWRY